MSHRVVYWNNIPAPYIVERFNALSQRGNLVFEAWFSGREEPGRSWTVDESFWKFRHRYLPALELNGRRLAAPAPLLTGEAPDLLVGLHAEPWFLPAWRLGRLRGGRTAIWVELTQDRVVRRRRWKEALKRHIFSHVDGVLTTGPDGRSFALRYGATQDRIVHVPHVIDFERYAAESAAAREERDEFRKRARLRGVTFLYVGRLLPDKGLTYLVEAFSALQRRNTDEVSLLLVGDGKEESVLRQRCMQNGVENVVFAGFRHRHDLPRFYAAADVFVFPTLGDTYGLVVDEALACGLPAISTSAAGEIRSRILDGTNGFIVPPESSAALLDRMELLSRDRDLRKRMSGASVRTVAGQSPEMWAQRFEAAVEHVLSLPRVTGLS
jgi:glycosyltransferase involved in cell wall biosynthesis